VFIITNDKRVKPFIFRGLLALHTEVVLFYILKLCL